MALITPGPAAGAISGNLGGVNFSVSRAGKYARIRPAHCNKSTTAQLNHRAALSHAYADWLALTDAQRLAWTRAAEDFPIKNRLHLPRLISGWTLYSAMAAPHGSDFLAPLTTPPLMSIAPQPYDVTLTINLPSTFSVDWEPPTNSTSYQVSLSAARTLSSSPSARPYSWTYLGAISPAPAPWNIQSLFEAALGTPQEDELVFVKIRIWQTNRIPSPQAQVSTVVLP